jgi:hypothetical protein
MTMLIAQEDAVTSLVENGGGINAALCEVDCRQCLNAGRETQDNKNEDC